MDRNWDAALVRDMLSRADENAIPGGRIAYRPDGLAAAYGLQEDGFIPSD